MIVRQTNYVSSRFDAATAEKLKQCDDVRAFMEGGSYYVSGFRGADMLVYAHIDERQYKKFLGIEEPNAWDEYYYGRREEEEVGSQGPRR